MYSCNDLTYICYNCGLATEILQKRYDNSNFQPVNISSFSICSPVACDQYLSGNYGLNFDFYAVIEKDENLYLSKFPTITV
jgi:acyl CoA:acetate/3-ketoacid CoA transferase alpha subunit